VSAGDYKQRTEDKNMSCRNHSPRFIALIAFISITLPISAFAEFKFPSHIETPSEGLFLRNLHSLDDEGRGYCLDIPGARQNINRDNPIGTRACKYLENNVDQLFQWVAPDTILAPEYENSCLTADKLAEGGRLFIRDCSEAEEQSWSISADGRFTPTASPELCLTFASERGISNSPAWLSTVYHNRAVSLTACSETTIARQQFRWGTQDERVREEAHQVGDDMPLDLAADIRRVTEAGVAASETSSLYADQPRTYELEEIDVVKNLSYGPHERHVLDVHTDSHRNGDGRPVIMYFHGGGFVRGNKDGNRNVADYFASLGLVGVNATYRLAPEAKWPDGANDVGAAVAWVKANIADYGGDPNQIFVVGKSAAAAHAATYAFRPEVLDPGIPAAAGVIMVSGGYGADTVNPGANRLAYFGGDLSRWSGISTIGNVERTSIPTMFTVSEFDNPGVALSLVSLMSEVAEKQGQMPRVVQLIGHNHYSPNPSVGTQDTQLSSAILQFVVSTAGAGTAH
jgi:triacylglycerol lipase